MEEETILQEIKLIRKLIKDKELIVKQPVDKLLDLVLLLNAFGITFTKTDTTKYVIYKAYDKKDLEYNDEQLSDYNYYEEN